MTVMQIAGVALISIAALTIIRTYRPDLALALSIAVCVVILIAVVGNISEIKGVVDEMLTGYGLDALHIKVIFKVIGIAYIAQFAADACRDAGEDAIASKVELAGRVLIVATAMQAMISILSLLQSLLVSA